MKKLLIIILAAMTATLSACTGGQQVVYSPKSDYWRTETGALVDFSEVCVYDIALEPSDSSPVRMELDEGTYTTEISTATEDGSTCYVYTTHLETKGRYRAYDGNTETSVFEFSDNVTQTTYFTFNGGFSCKRSETDAVSTVPVNRNGVMDENGNRFVSLKYKYSIVYGEKNAEITFNIVGTDEEKAALADYFSLKDGYSGTYKKYNRRVNYIDSNIMELLPRTFDFSTEGSPEGLSYSFASIDALSLARRSMNLSAYTPDGSETAFETEDILNVYRAGTPLGTKEYNEEKGVYEDENGKFNYLLESTAVFNTRIRINETYSGSALLLRYISESPTNYRHYMYQKISALPYSMGTLVYTLSKINP